MPIFVNQGISVILLMIACGAFPATATFGQDASRHTRTVIWLEAEGFQDNAGWSNDSQFVDLMGSPYLLAGGVGKPVADAVTNVEIAQTGRYHLWVRCKDWLPGHSPGRFRVLVDDKDSAVTFGKAETDNWQWVDGGTFQLHQGQVKLRLRDLTGWWGRCDAVVLAQGNFKPADDLVELAKQRAHYGAVSDTAEKMGPYDVVVVGGGPAGCGAAVAAARHGCKVAFIQDRPLLGGNASCEISVPPMGYVGKPPDKVNITGLVEEFFPIPQDWAAFADSAKIEKVVRAEKNISLFLNTRANGVQTAGADRIKSVLALNVHSGERMEFLAPLFIDCTGHGWVGYYAGAEYRMGQEARAEFNESLAPVEPGKRTMGNNLYNGAFKEHDEPVPFECPDWACKWTKPEDFEPLGSHRRIKDIRRPENFDVPARGRGRNPGNDLNGGVLRKWWVEYGGTLNVIEDAEKIRDELFRINIGLWNYAKNHNPNTTGKNQNRELAWLNYVMGVRESRRLVGDYIMSQQDYDRQTVHEDTIAFTDWGIDVHHPEGFWVKGNDVIHVYTGRRTSIPYRTLYSRNIGNLFMAGRCHSATHIALGGTRVMRPMCMTGQAAGTAAAIARKYKTNSRGVYKHHIKELQQALLKDGCYLVGVKNSDRNDLALRAKITAHSCISGMEPEKINNGWNRIVGKARNAWAPDLTSQGPHWVQLQLDRAAIIDTIHITFEKTVVDCHISAWSNGSWKTVTNVAGNKSRRCVLGFEPVDTDKIRLIFEKPTSPPAICEVRLYYEQPGFGQFAGDWISS